MGIDLVPVVLSMSLYTESIILNRKCTDVVNPGPCDLVPQQYAAFQVRHSSCVLIPNSSSGAGNDYQKDIQFRKLNASKDVFMVKVLRGGQQSLVSSADIVVGDVLLLDTGDKVRNPRVHNPFQM